VLVSKDDGAPTFAMRMFEVQPGGHTPLHRHPHEHEVFVLQGKGVVVHEGKDYPLTPEVVVFVPGGDEHCFKNTGNSTLRFLCLVPLSGA
jgi:quercetin dioxygenase-like cupin family protein